MSAFESAKAYFNHIDQRKSLITSMTTQQHLLRRRKLANQSYLDIGDNLCRYDNGSKSHHFSSVKMYCRKIYYEYLGNYSVDLRQNILESHAISEDCDLNSYHI